MNLPTNPEAWFLLYPKDKIQSWQSHYPNQDITDEILCGCHTQ